MINAKLYVGRRPGTRRYRVYIVGQADHHVADYLGLNERIKSVEDQPRTGFDTPRKAAAWARKRFRSYLNVRRYGKRIGNASGLSTAQWYELELEPIRYLRRRSQAQK